MSGRDSVPPEYRAVCEMIYRSQYSLLSKTNRVAGSTSGVLFREQFDMERLSMAIL